MSNKNMELMVQFANRHGTVQLLLEALAGRWQKAHAKREDSSYLLRNELKELIILINENNLVDVCSFIKCNSKFFFQEEDNFIVNLVSFAKEYEILDKILAVIVQQSEKSERKDLFQKNIIKLSKKCEVIPEMIEALSRKTVGKELHTVGEYENKESIMEDLVTALKDELSEKTKTVTQQQAVNPQQVSNFNNLLARAEEAIKFLDESWCKSLIEPIIETAETAISEAESKLNPGGPK